MGTQIDFKPIDFQPEAPTGGGIQFEEEAPSMKEKILWAARGLARGLDYPGGLVRGAIGRANGSITPQEWEDAYKIGTGKSAPDNATMDERRGVPAGKSASQTRALGWLYEDPSQTGEDTWWPNKDGFLDVTERGAKGFAKDMLEDPLNWLSWGSAGAAKKAGTAAIRGTESGLASALKAAPRKAVEKGLDLATLPAEKILAAARRVPGIGATAEAAATFPSAIVRGVGNKAYRAGLLPLVEQGEKRGKDVLDTFYKYGISSLGDLGEGLQPRANMLKGVRDKIHAAADAAGATVSREKAFDPMFQRIKTLVDKRMLSPEDAEKLLQEFSETMGKGGDPGAALATEWKTNVRHGVPSSAWVDLKTKAPSLVHQLEQDVGSGLQHGVTDAITQVEPKIAKEVGKGAAAKAAQANSDLGDILTVMDKAKSMSYKQTKVMDPIDWLILSGEMNVPGNATLGVFGAKKAYEALATPAGRIRSGYHLKRLGQNRVLAPALDMSVRRKIIDKVKEPNKENDDE
jgi:hypothetical protein